MYLAAPPKSIPSIYFSAWDAQNMDMKHAAILIPFFGAISVNRGRVDIFSLIQDRANPSANKVGAPSIGIIFHILDNPRDRKIQLGADNRSCVKGPPFFPAPGFCRFFG